MLRVTVTYTIQDGKGKTGKVLYHTNIDDDNTFGFGNFNTPFEDAVDYFQEIGRRIDLVVKGKVVNIEMTVKIPLPTVKPSPAADSDVEEIASFEYQATDAPYWKNSIPAFDHDLFGGAKTVLAQTVPEIDYLTRLVGFATEADDWAAEYGGITDVRGSTIEDDDPTVHKRFKRR